MSKDDELEELWKLFEDTPEQIKLRRKEITQTLQNDLSLDEFPTQMSIVGAFDDLLGCFALGGQVKHYYMYGSHDMCFKQREKLWFAIKNGTMYESKEKDVLEMGEREVSKRLKIQEFYKKRLLESKAKGLSEDVWNARKETLVGAFGRK